MELIAREKIYNRINELEDKALQRTIDCSSESPAYTRYREQLNERTSLKHEIMDAETVLIIPDRPTNGTILEAMYPKLKRLGESEKTIDISLGGFLQRYSKDWWNKPYEV